MSQALKDKKKEFETKNESLHEIGKETRRLRASYQSFKGRSLKTTCMKLGRRRNGLYSS